MWCCCIILAHRVHFIQKKFYLYRVSNGVRGIQMKNIKVNWIHKRSYVLCQIPVLNAHLYYLNFCFCCSLYISMCCCVLFYIYLFSVSACEKKSSSTNKEGKRICSQEYARKDEMNNKKDTIHSIFICCFSLFFTYFYFICNRTKTKYLNYKHK